MQKQNSRYPVHMTQFRSQSVLAPVYLVKLYDKLGKKPPSGRGGSGPGSQPDSNPGSRDGGSAGGGGRVDSTPDIQWSKLLEPAKDAAQLGVNTWAAHATIEGSVQAMSAVGSPGCLTSNVDFRPTIFLALADAGAPWNIAEDFADGLWSAWTEWRSAYTIPGLPWYPAFTLFPAPYAPPISNVPTPLAMGVSANMASVSSILTEKISAKLGSSVMIQNGALPFVSKFSLSFGLAFAVWLNSAKWMFVLGEGPVPSYAPPYGVPGPVVNGKFRGNEGCLNGTFTIILLPY